METIVSAAIGAAALIVTTWMTTRASARHAAGSAHSTGSAERASEPPQPSFGERLVRGRARIWQLFVGLPPLGRQSRPALAAMLAFLFSGFGIALYFRKLPDVLAGIGFLVPLGLASGGDPAAGESTIAWWYWFFAALAGLYALLRAESSNRRLESG